MPDYYVDYRFVALSGTPVLLVTVSGRLLTDPRAIPAILDQAHRYADQCGDYESVYLVYDFGATEGKLPLNVLMGRAHNSRKVRRVGVVGARARSDEMSMLIMATAKRVPYEIEFFDSVENAFGWLSTQGSPVEH